MPEKREKRFLKDTFETAKEKIERGTEKTREVIRENPIKSIVIAAIVGAMVGVAASELIRRARQRQKKSFLRKLRRMF